MQTSLPESTSETDELNTKTKESVRFFITHANEFIRIHEQNRRAEHENRGIREVFIIVANEITRIHE